MATDDVFGKDAQIPPAEPPSVELLNKMLHEGIEALLKNAEEEDVLEPPYGHKQPATLIDLELDADDEDDEDDPFLDDEEEEENEEDDEPKFEYDYGFNPLVFLGAYLEKYNPKNVRARRVQRQQAVRYLDQRAQAALKCSRAFDFLKEKVSEMRSGIALGPMCGCINSNSGKLWVKTAVSGQVIFELSHDATFEHVAETLVGDSTPDSKNIVTVLADHLQSSSTYYYRACVQNTQSGFPGPDAGYFSYGKFTTLPDQDENTAFRFCVVGCPLYTKGHRMAGLLGQPACWSKVVDSICQKQSNFLVLNGGLVPKDDARAVNKKANEEKTDALISLSVAQLGDPSMRKLLSSQPIFVGFNDELKGAQTSLKAEESVMEKAEKEKRKKRKPWEQTVDPRGELSVPLKVLDMHFPVAIEDDVTRHCFKRTRYGMLAEIITLDTRGRSLGRVQSEWLVEQVTHSPCTWKLVVTVYSLAYGQKLSEDAEAKAGRKQVNLSAGLDVANEQELRDQEQATLKIQAIQRGRLARKRATEEPPQSPSKTKGPARMKSPSPAANGNTSLDGSKDSKAQPAAVKQPIGEAIATIAAEGVSGVVLLTTDPGQPFAIKYSPPDAPDEDADEEATVRFAKGMVLHEFGVAPLGVRDTQAAPAAGLEAMNPEFIMPTVTGKAGPTFGTVEVAQDGKLTYYVCGEDGSILQSVTLDPPAKSKS